MKKLMLCFMMILPFIGIGQNEITKEGVDSLVNKPADSLIMIEVVKPVFPGGQKALTEYLNHNIRYTNDAITDKVEGTVIISFLVYEDGSVADIKVVKGIHPSLDQIAVDAIKNMPDWLPGTLNGKPTKQELNLPVRFTLPRKLKK